MVNTINRKLFKKFGGIYVKIGIVGKGHVGSAMLGLFKAAVVYDEPKKIGNKKAINDCDIVFICVPTPMNEDSSCNTTIIDEVISWLSVSTIVIRSTVPVGYTDRVCIETNKNIVFQPEYYGETVAHPFSDLTSRNWITIGGNKNIANEVIKAYQTVYNSDLHIRLVDAKVAELAKYMENAYLATKVTFCNEFYDIAQKFDVDYNELRETWLEDPRIGRSHTFVYSNNRGYGGACLPKDINSIIFQADELKVDCTLLKAVEEKNKKYK